MFALFSRLMLSIALAMWIGPAVANTITPEKNAFNRVKLLERQILLSEQISTAVCLMLANIESASQSDKARGAAELFATVQSALRTGDENMAILPEGSPAVLAALEEIDAVFHTFRAATLQLVNNDLHSVPVSQIMRLDDTLMVLVRNAVEIVTDEYGQASASFAVRTTQSSARRQTLLSQRVAKDLCYITIDINADAMRQELSQTLAVFEDTQSQLRYGNSSAHILPPPKAAVIKKLDAVDALWAQLSALTENATSTGNSSEEILVQVLDLSNKLLFKTKQVARSYGR